MTRPAPRPSFPGLDTLRALAALGVVVTHVAFFAGAYSTGLRGTGLARLDIGVAVFFALSGFLLSRPYLAAARDGGSADRVGRYLWKRVLRILPVYWISSAAAFMLLRGNHHLPPWRWLTTATLTDVFAADQLPQGLTQMWSLSIEAAFYLVLPGLMFLATRRLRRGWSASWAYAFTGVLGVFGTAWLVAANGVLAPLYAVTSWWLPQYLLWFSVGMMIAVASVDRHTSGTSLTRVLHGMAASPSTCWAAAAALFVIACTPIAGPANLALLTDQQSFAKSILYAAIALLVILPSALGHPASRYAATLAHPVLRHLGHISYAVFCCHQLIIIVLADAVGYTAFTGHGLPLFAMTVLASWLVAEALHWAVERPSQRLRNLGRTPATNAPSEMATKN